MALRTLLLSKPSQWESISWRNHCNNTETITRVTARSKNSSSTSITLLTEIKFVLVNSTRITLLTTAIIRITWWSKRESTTQNSQCSQTSYSTSKTLKTELDHSPEISLFLTAPRDIRNKMSTKLNNKKLNSNKLYNKYKEIWREENLRRDTHLGSLKGLIQTDQMIYKTDNDLSAIYSLAT